MAAVIPGNTISTLLSLEKQYNKANDLIQKSELSRKEAFNFLLVHQDHQSRELTLSKIKLLMWIQDVGLRDDAEVIETIEKIYSVNVQLLYKRELKSEHLDRCGDQNKLEFAIAACCLNETTFLKTNVAALKTVFGIRCTTTQLFALHAAVVTERPEIFSCIFENAPLSLNNYFPKEGLDEKQSPVQLAVILDKKMLVECLVKENPRLCHWKDMYDNTPLHVAVHNDKLEIVRAVMALQPDLFQTKDSRGHTSSALFDENGFTAVHLAAWINKIEMLQLFYALDPNCFRVLDQNGRTPLKCAFINKQNEAIKEIISLDRGVLAIFIENDYFPVHLAAFIGSEEIISFIAELDRTQLHLRHKSKYLPIHIAIERDHDKAVAKMLKIDPSLASVMHKDLGLLKFAVARHAFKSIRLLDQVLPKQTKSGCVPLQITVNFKELFRRERVIWGAKLCLAESSGRKVGDITLIEALRYLKNEKAQNLLDAERKAAESAQKLLEEESSMKMPSKRGVRSSKPRKKATKRFKNHTRRSQKAIALPKSIPRYDERDVSCAASSSQSFVQTQSQIQLEMIGSLSAFKNSLTLHPRVEMRWATKKTEALKQIVDKDRFGNLNRPYEACLKDELLEIRSLHFTPGVEKLIEHPELKEIYSIQLAEGKYVLYCKMKHSSKRTDYGYVFISVCTVKKQIYHRCFTKLKSENSDLGQLAKSVFDFEAGTLDQTPLAEEGWISGAPQFAISNKGVLSISWTGEEHSLYVYPIRKDKLPAL